jgi:hypothetical protein
LGFASDIKPRAIVPPASSALPNPLYKNPRTALTPFVNLCVRKFIPLIVILYNIIKKSGGKKIFFEFYLSITFNKYGLSFFLWFRPHTTDNYFILQYIFYVVATTHSALYQKSRKFLSKNAGTLAIGYLYDLFE